MAEGNQVQQVTMKDHKKVAPGRNLVEWNHKNKERLAQPDKAQKSESELI